MAKAKKCDRCGQLYEAYYETSNEEALFDWNHMELAREDKSGGLWARGRYDLCIHCASDLYKWLEDKDTSVVKIESEHKQGE